MSVRLEGESGGQLETYYQHGQTWVLGQHGARYAVRIHNHQPERVEVVLSVDGRDAVSGQVTDGVRHRGYVIPAYGSLRVEGFRTSLDSVAAFRFTDPASSYTGRMGSPHLAGVITVTAFPERTFLDRPLTDPRVLRRDWQGPPPPASGPSGADDVRKHGRATPGHAAESRARLHGEVDLIVPWPRGPVNNLGTEFGEARSSRVVEVDFARAQPTAPAQRISIRYDDAEGLEARGIEVRPRPLPWPEPRPVTLSPVPERRFAAPPPPHWDWVD